MPLPVPVHPINPAPPIRYEQTVSQSTRVQPQQPLNGGVGGGINSQESYNRQIIQDSVNPQMQSIIQRQQQEQSDFIRPGPDIRASSGVSGGFNSRMQYDAPQPQQLSPYAAQVPAQPQNNWIPHQSNQMPPQIPQYADKSSHIYNHKDSGLQVPDGQDISSMQYADGANSRDYQKMQGYYPDSYRQNMQQDNWPNTQQEDNRYSNNRYGQDARVKDWHADLTHDVPKKTVPNTIQQPPAATFDHQVDLKTENENPVHVQDKMSHELKQSKDIMEHRETSIKIEKHKNSQTDLEVTAIKLSPDFQDGIAETPGGAVLSLTLGLIITCIMAILIGCRLRVVRRRMRKGGKAYAHDADYLVNGMYL